MDYEKLYKEALERAKGMDDPEFCKEGYVIMGIKVLSVYN